MPKAGIKAAACEIAAELKRKGFKGVWVPRAKTKKPDWCPPNKTEFGTWMPLPELVDILEFVLDHSYVMMPNGTILRQKDGIPMGDPLSPGMTILTCAWMEREWLLGMEPLDHMFFRGCRYMDDILMFISNSSDFDSKRFKEDFMRSECYWSPLKLEKVDATTFLETRIFYDGDGELSYRLKNDNENGKKIWRYHDYRSRLSYTCKRATILGALQKVDRMASDSHQRVISAVAKCQKFIELGYPNGIFDYLCCKMANQTRHLSWLDVPKYLICPNRTRSGCI